MCTGVQPGRPRGRPLTSGLQLPPLRRRTGVKGAFRFDSQGGGTPSLCSAVVHRRQAPSPLPGPGPASVTLGWKQRRLAFKKCWEAPRVWGSPCGPPDGPPRLGPRGLSPRGPGERRSERLRNVSSPRRCHRSPDRTPQGGTNPPAAALHPRTHDPQAPGREELKVLPLGRSRPEARTRRPPSCRARRNHGAWTGARPGP